MTDIKIRQYQPTDIESCRSLWVDLTQRHRDIYENSTIGGEDPGMHFDKHLSRVGDQNIWVAEHEGKVIGMVGLVQEDEPEVEPIVVAPEHRNRQVGSKLLEHVIGRAKELGLRFLSVRPVTRNQEAISLFHRTGFKILGHIEMFMDLNPEPQIVWRPGPELQDHHFEH
jgi:ribosomal protein S18 acetylase RimI-like enzyme